MATTEERLTKLEGGAAAAGWEGFGTPPGTGGDGTDPYSRTPGGGVTADGVTPLPWNAQAGEASRQTFQGAVSIPLVPTPGFTGWREVSLSQVDPQFQVCSAKVDGDDTELSNTNAGGSFKVYFADGQQRTLHLKPSPERGAGQVQFVGGIAPQ